MTFPTVASVTATAVGATGTSVTVSMPAAVNAGDLLIAVLYRDSGATYTWPAGWTELVDATAGTGQGLTIGYKIAAGTEGGTTVTVTASLGTASRAAQTFRITGWHGTTPPEIATNATTGNNPDPPNLAPSWGADDNLWIVGMGTEKTSGFATYPTNYANDQHASQLTNTYTLAVCSRNLNASSENPGTFGTFGGSPRYLAFTIAVQPGSSGQNVAPILLTDGDTFYGATVAPGAASVLPALFTDADTFFAATVGRGAVGVSPTLFTDGDTFFAPTVAPGLVDVAPALFTDSDTFYAPTVVEDGGTQDVAPALFSDSDAFFAATIAAGAVGILPALFTDADVFFAAVVAGRNDVAPALLSDGDTFFGPTVAAGAANVAPDAYTDDNVFFAPTISGGVTHGRRISQALYY